jgi:transcriptional regulator with XRE-family HTH domain
VTRAAGHANARRTPAKKVSDHRHDLVGRLLRWYAVATIFFGRTGQWPFLEELCPIPGTIDAPESLLGALTSGAQTEEALVRRLFAGGTGKTVPFGVALRMARKQRGYSQASLSGILRVSKRTVGTWERESNRPWPIHYARLSELFPELQQYEPARTEAPRRLVQWLQTNGVTQVDMAYRLGVSRQAVTLYVHGKSRPRRHVASRIESVAGVPATTWGHP